ncbi:MAG: PBS lyase [Desulfobulbaceae bacterium]|jgi:hypothetical protein|nr:PBS lyase [Desulfobulbaceae bacterium]
MMRQGESHNVKPFCPFCGADVGRPGNPVQRKLTEFPVGKCECGAVYASDATGHNVGAAMVECLVAACHDDWDLAWELVPEDDYLTGRIERYDEVNHQVVPAGTMDGRTVRGVLYFVRLHRELEEIAARFDHRQEAGAGGAEAGEPLIEPRRDPKRRKKRADKQLVKELAAAGDIDALVDYCFDDRRTLRFLQRLLYEPDEADRYWAAWVIGQVCARVSSREPGPVADLMHRLFEACSDSAATSWGMIEAIGCIIAARPDIYGAFTRHLLSFMGDTSTQAQVIWALGEIARTRPDLIRKTPFYALLPFLGHEKTEIRGLVVRLMGRIRAAEAALQIMGLRNDQSEMTVYEQGRPQRTSVARLAAEAMEMIHSKGDAANE